MKIFIICPFCYKRHQRISPYLNVICPCGAKYYAHRNFWVDRKTGECKGFVKEGEKL